MVYEKSYGIIPLKQVRGEWQVFVILHKNGFHWGFPKGKADEGENPLTSATRELKEETGLEVEKILRDSPIVEQYVFMRRGERIKKEVSYFPAIVSGALLLQPEEIADGKWVNVGEAFDLLTFKEARDVLSKVAEQL